jgi:hypothetical protein
MLHAVVVAVADKLEERAFRVQGGEHERIEFVSSGDLHRSE